MSNDLGLRRVTARVSAVRVAKEMGLAAHPLGKQYVALADIFDSTGSADTRVVVSREMRQVYSLMCEAQTASQDEDSFVAKGRRDFNPGPISA